jgi:hypothetical protein
MALREDVTRLQPAQHFEVGRLLEQASDVFELGGHGKLLFLCAVETNRLSGNRAAARIGDR